MENLTIVDYQISEFDKIEEIWRALEIGSDMTVFQTYEWYKWLNESYDLEYLKRFFREWRYIVCYQDNKPLMIAPIQINRIGISIKGVGVEKSIHIIGNRYSDYLNFIYDNFNLSAVDCIIHYIKETYNQYHFVLDKIPQGNSFSKFLHEKYQVDTKKQESCADLKLPETFELYTKSLKKSARQNIRTAINRQNRDGLNVSHQMVYELSKADKEELIRIRASRLKEKNKRDIKKITSRIYNWFETNTVGKQKPGQHIFECLNKKWYFIVKNDEEIIGFYSGIFDEKNRTYYVILAGVSKKYEWYSPSISHLYLFIQELYDSKNDAIKVFDFTRGQERYKVDIGGTEKFIDYITIEV